MPCRGSVPCGGDARLIIAGRFRIQLRTDIWGEVEPRFLRNQKGPGLNAANPMSEASPRDNRRPPLPGTSGQRTRDAILRAAASLAAEDGPDGLSAGPLAAALGRSEIGRPVPSGSRQELQLAIVTEAARIFDEEVV